MSIPNNKGYVKDYITTVMTLWWNIQETIVNQYFNDETSTDNRDKKTGQYTRFGIIYFAAKSAIYLDLEFGYTLNDYISYVTHLFDGRLLQYLPFSRDDTNIVAALYDAYNMFVDGETIYFNKQGLTRKRLLILLTDGHPTIPSWAVSPCDITYNYNRLFAKGS